MWVKRKRQRLNSTALWQGWKAKVVHHINQKLVTKKSGSNWSAMLALPSLSSGSTIKRFSVETFFSFSPNAGAHSLFSGAQQPGLGRHFRAFVPVEDLFCDR